MNQKIFDRSVCFTFFDGFYSKAKIVERKYGKEAALRFYKQLCEYALYEIQPEESEDFYDLMIPIMETIDRSQDKRRQIWYKNNQ